MLFSLATQDIGQQTLNRIAEFALASQLDESENLSVDVKTDPSLLAQGKLASLTIAGDGLVMQKDLRMQKLVIKLENIAVSPIKALTGNIELTETSTGKADILLTDADLNRAFNSETLRGQMQNLHMQVEDQPVTLDVLAVECHLLGEGTIAIDARIKIRETEEVKRTSFTTTPRVSEGGRGVSLENVTYDEGKELSPQLTTALLEKARNILNLDNFEVEGIALEINQLSLREGELSLSAIAQITKFPKP